MKCPADEAELKMTERQGIEIDYCPQCRGVWLDRGELDRIIERSASVSSSSSERGRSEERYDERDRDDRYRDERDEKYNDNREGRSYQRKGKRKSFLGDLFDFD